MQDKEETEAAESEDTTKERSASSEVIKEVDHGQLYLTSLTELDSIAQLIIALESMIAEQNVMKAEEEKESERLDAGETVTMEFLQMLEEEERNEYSFDQPEIPYLQLEGIEYENDSSMEAESKVYLSDLGKALGCIAQTNNGGCVVAANPLNTGLKKRYSEVSNATVKDSGPSIN